MCNKFILKLNNNKINQIEICALIGLLMAIFCCFFNLITDTQNLSSKILRLHILANSNSQADQNLKIKLKNNLLQNFNFDDYSNNVDEAKKKLKLKLHDIETHSKNFIKTQGFNYNVKAKIKKTNFNTKKYGDFALPPSIYEALTIEIGKAKGHNWWCVFVPSMCVPAATKTKQKIEQNLNSNQCNLIEKGSKTEIRFAVLQLCQNIKQMFI